jgi:hypothetical protein
VHPSALKDKYLHSMTCLNHFSSILKYKQKINKNLANYFLGMHPLPCNVCLILIIITKHLHMQADIMPLSLALVHGYMYYDNLASPCTIKNFTTMTILMLTINAAVYSVIPWLWEWWRNVTDSITVTEVHLLSKISRHSAEARSLKFTTTSDNLSGESSVVRDM